MDGFASKIWLILGVFRWCYTVRIDLALVVQWLMVTAPKLLMMEAIEFRSCVMMKNQASDLRNSGF